MSNSAVNTDDGVVLEALNDKADRDFNNTNAAGIPFDTIDYVIDRGGDNSKWYRLWRSGWLEQGGFEQAAIKHNISFLVPYRNTAFFCVVTHHADALNDTYQQTTINGKTTTSVTLVTTRGSSRAPTGVDWLCMGYSA